MRFYWIFRREIINGAYPFGGLGPLEVTDKEDDIPKHAWRVKVQEVK